jgi:hypothetical protein
MKSVFHAGEREVQRRAGVTEMAKRVGNGIHDRIPEAAQEFLGEQSFIVLGAADAQGQLWATVLTGEPGFITAQNDRQVYINALPMMEDPFFALLNRTPVEGVVVGTLAIEPVTRRRMRLNGGAFRSGKGLIVRAEQVYANCPKYIQKREIVSGDALSQTQSTAVTGNRLTPEQIAAIRRADTFFIATGHPEGGADVSHRGGNPGFVRVSEDGARLYWPDYAGNAMFNTLGNIAAHPATGLLFIDFDGSGTMLHLTGEASLLWDETAEQLTGAERGVAFSVREVVERPGAFPLRFRFGDYSRFNPA